MATVNVHTFITKDENRVVVTINGTPHIIADRRKVTAFTSCITLNAFLCRRYVIKIHSVEGEVIELRYKDITLWKTILNQLSRTDFSLS